MNRPKVSVLICNYNYGRFLGQAIGSAINQTLSPHEILVYDDGSTDDSLNVIRKHGVPFIRGSRLGVAVGRTRLIERATGSHVLLLDADDWLEPSALESAARIISSTPGAKATYGEFRWSVESPKTQLPAVYRSTPKILDIDSCYCVLHYMPCHTIVFPREWAVPWNASLTTSEDQAFWSELLLRGARFHHLDVTVAVYRLHRSSRSSGVRLRSLRNTLDIHEDLLRRYPEGRSHSSYLRHVRWRQYKLGIALLRAGRRIEGAREILGSIRDLDDSPSRRLVALTAGMVLPSRVVRSLTRYWDQYSFRAVNRTSNVREATRDRS